MLKIHIIFFTVLASLCSIALPIKAMVKIVSVEKQVQKDVPLIMVTLVLTLSNGEKAIIENVMPICDGTYSLPIYGLNSKRHNLYTLPELEKLLSDKSQVISEEDFKVNIHLKPQHVGNNVYRIVGFTAPKSV